MAVFDHAMDLEKESEKYYRQMADIESNKRLKKIFIIPADEEVKHSELIKNLQAKNYEPASKSDILSNSKEIFKQFSSETEFNLNPEIPDIFRIAQDNNLKSKEYYIKSAEQADNNDEKKILLYSADEEDNHLRLIENLIDFYLHSKTLIDNADFYHMDEF